MERVYGPYPNRDKWRIVAVSGSRRVARTFETQAEALAAITAFRAKSNGRDVEQAIQEYLIMLCARGARERTGETAGLRLRGLLRPLLQCPVTDVTAARAASLYGAYRATRSAATHRGALREAGRFGRHAVKVGWLAANPFQGVEPVGQVERGKPQLRLDEVRKLYTWLLPRLADDRALAALACLLLGLRAGELVALVPRDLDDAGRLLWISRAKTRAGVRPLVVPAVLIPHLTKLAKARQGRLFPRRREWVRDAARWACGGAGVPVVCAHALRGSHATIALEAGASPEHVARSLGHANVAVTFGHYAQTGSGRSSAVERVGERIRLDSSPTGVAVDSESQERGTTGTNGPQAETR